MSATGRRAVVLVEDEGWIPLRPLTWLRPAADIIVGAWTPRERWARAAGVEPTVLCRPIVAPLAPGRTADASGVEGSTVLWARDRWIPDPAWARAALSARKIPCVWRVDNAVLAVFGKAPPPRDSVLGTDSFWEALAEGAVEADSPPAGAWIGKLSDLTRESPALLARDLEAMTSVPPEAGGREGGRFGGGEAGRFGDGHAYSPEGIRVGEGCRIDHGAVLDARTGPIVLGAGTAVAPGTWVRGPFLCRDGCVLLGGTIGGGTVLGPGCRVRGEVESTTFLGHSNKAHDGFVGHSFVGEWVNLGALTTTSDLKNNYGPVHLEIDGRRVETEQMKVGSFIGDHAKTRIGTLLNSGTVIGMAANLFGEVSLFPKWIPDFAWGAGPGAGEYAIDRCLATAEVVMTRRGERFTPEIGNAIAEAFRESRPARERALKSAESAAR